MAREGFNGNMRAAGYNCFECGNTSNREYNNCSLRYIYFEISFPTTFKMRVSFAVYIVLYIHCVVFLNGLLFTNSITQLLTHCSGYQVRHY